jgi:hypothetical protein
MMIGIGIGTNFPHRDGGPSFVGPLDDYTSGLKIAWDVRRRLLSSYTGALFEVRADRSGQPTFDVPFKADGTWDTAALLSFAGSDSCYVTQVYPQIGSIVFAQATAANQPRIVNAGVLELFGARFNGFNDLEATLDAADFTGSSGTTLQVVTQLRQAAADTGDGLWSFNSQQSGCFVKYPALGIISDLPAASRIIVNPSDWDDATHVLSQERNGGTADVRVDGTVIATNASASGAVSGTDALFLIGQHGGHFIGWLSLFCIWDNTTDAAGRAAALP